MSLFSYKEHTPKILESNFIAPGAMIIGRVHLEQHVNIWYNCVLRGDVNKITIGENTNIQDLSMLHVTAKDALKIGKNVTVGHSVVLHGCTIGDGSLIGMGAKILDGVQIGNNSLVAAGSIVTPGKKFPDNSFIIGSPAICKRELTVDEIKQYSNHYKSYVGYAKDYLDSSIVSEFK